MKKEIRELTPRMQKFREAIHAFNVRMSFVKGVHNHISDALLRSTVGGSEGIDKSPEKVERSRFLRLQQSGHLCHGGHL